MFEVGSTMKAHRLLVARLMSEHVGGFLQRKPRSLSIYKIINASVQFFINARLNIAMVHASHLCLCGSRATTSSLSYHWAYAQPTTMLSTVVAEVAKPIVGAYGVVGFIPFFVS